MTNEETLSGQSMKNIFRNLKILCAGRGTSMDKRLIDN